MSAVSTIRPGSILIRGGHLLDPSQNIDAPRDLLLEQGRVAAIAESGRLETAREARRTDAGQAEVIDARGLIVAPGLIDIHAQVVVTTSMK